MFIGKIKSILKWELYKYQVDYCPKKILSEKYKKAFGHEINWDNPQDLNEKIQWLQVYSDTSEWSRLTDKYLCREFIREKGYENLLVKFLGVYHSAEEINYDALPEKFVLKCNHDSGTGMCICTDKSKLDYSSVRKGLNEGLKSDYYPISREWPYKNVKRKVFAEQYMKQEDSSDLTDYKWFCFNGKPLYCQVIRNRSSKETIDFFDTEWNHQSFIGFNPRAVHAENCPSCPKNLSLMIELATSLSRDLPFSRVDLYEINGNVYFGEITFFPAGGFGAFRPKKMDRVFGQYLVLPKLKDC